MKALTFNGIEKITYESVESKLVLNYLLFWQLRPRASSKNGWNRMGFPTLLEIFLFQFPHYFGRQFFSGIVIIQQFFQRPVFVQRMPDDFECNQRSEAEKKIGNRTYRGTSRSELRSGRNYHWGTRRRSEHRLVWPHSYDYDVCQPNHSRDPPRCGLSFSAEEIFQRPNGVAFLADKILFGRKFDRIRLRWEILCVA